MVEELTEKDVISIVTYSGDERVVLEGVKGSDKETIIEAINNLETGGSTNGEAGLKKAYEIAVENSFVQHLLSWFCLMLIVLRF